MQMLRCGELLQTSVFSNFVADNYMRQRVGLSHGDKGCMSSSDLALIYSGRWGKGVKDGKRKRGQEGGKKTQRKWRLKKLSLLPGSECQAWAVAPISSLSLTHSCCAWGSVIFPLHRTKKEVETWQE